MRPSRMIATLGLCLAATIAHAGAPEPETRQGDFAHVCRGGANRNLSCTVPTQGSDCPGSECVVLPLSPAVKGVLTIIAHDAVTDWANGGATNQALTVMLEVRAPNGTQQMLAATYQHLADPTSAPTALSNVVAIDMDEFALANLSEAVTGLLFAQPESTLTQQLQTLFDSEGTPVLVAATDRQVQSADHTGDGLATVVRFKVKIQFLQPRPL